jgi:hypothetical protein
MTVRTPASGAGEPLLSPAYIRGDGTVGTADALIADLNRVAVDIRAAISVQIFPDVAHADRLLDAISVCVDDLAMAESKYFDLDTI